MKKYENLKNRYPDFVSMDEFSRICKIAKRSARYLVENKIIPSIDTGRKTWRYKIAIDDVITYLRKREQVGSMIPPGAVTNRKENRERKKSNRKSFSQLVVPGQEHEVAEYFKYIYADYDGLLTAVDMAEMTGLHKNTIQKLIKAGYIKAIMTSPKYLVPKQYLLDFVVTRKFIETQTDSEQLKKIIGGFEIWKNAKLSQ